MALAKARVFGQARAVDWRLWRELSLTEHLYYLRAYHGRSRTLWDDAPPTRAAFLERLAVGRAVDAGCGSGRDAVALAERGWRVTGVDLSGAALARACVRAAARGVSVDWVRGPASYLDEHLRSPADLVLDVFGPASDLEGEARARYTRAVLRSLAPGGLWAIFSFERLDPLLADFVVDQDLTLITPPTAAGRWWLLRPRSTAATASR